MSKKIVLPPKENVNARGLTRKEFDLIDEGVTISKQKNAAEKRLKEIKELLKLDKGTYTTPKGGVLLIAARDEYEVPPEDLLEYLKANKKSKLFFSCVKVIKDALDSTVGTSVYETLKKWKKETPTFSFK